MLRLLPILLAVASLSMASLSAGQDKPSLLEDPRQPDVQGAAQSLLDHARRVSDIRAVDAPAFRLKATFSFPGDDLETVEGMYTETWVSDQQWRREIVIGNSRRIEVASPDKTWLVYPDGFPARAVLLPALMAFVPPESFDTDYATIKERVTREVTAQCAYSRPVMQNRSYAFCYEKRTGVLLETVVPERHPRNVTSRSCEYGTFRKFGTYVFPREIVCYEDTHRVISANVTDLTLEPVMDPTLFEAPAGAIEFPVCSGKVVRPWLSMNELRIPGFDPDRMAWINVWFVVDVKGKAQELRVLRSTGNGSHEKALAIVRGWHFNPGTCDGKPIPMPLVKEVPFTPSK